MGISLRVPIFESFLIEIGQEWQEYQKMKSELKLKTDSNVSNADLLDKLKEGFDYKTDIEVAGFLGLNKDTVSQIRQGLQGLSIAQRFKIMDRLVSIQIRNLLVKIAPDHLYREIHRLSLHGAEGLAFDEIEAGEPEEIDVKLIDLFKSYGQKLNLVHTDQQMADFLGLKRATISSVRTGKCKLGPLPRLRMLKAINPETDIEQVLNGIESNKSLHDLIEKHIEIQ
jgi:transcriptional regulator with XRE-family HTH domain